MSSIKIEKIVNVVEAENINSGFVAVGMPTTKILTICSVVNTTPVWGEIVGDLNDQTDLMIALALKANLTGGFLDQAENPQASIADIRYWSPSSVVTGDRNGSFDYPYATFQDAVNSFGTPTSQADFNRQVFIVCLERPTVTETITLPTRRWSFYFLGGTMTGNWTMNIDNALRFGSSFSPGVDVYSATRNLGTQIIGNFLMQLSGTPVTNIAGRLTNTFWTGNYTIADGTNGGSSVTTGTNSQLSLINAAISGTFLGRNIGVSLVTSSILGNVDMQALLSVETSLLNGLSIAMYGTATTTRSIFGLTLNASGGVTWNNVNVSPRWSVDDYSRGQLDSLATITTNQFTYQNPTSFNKPYRAITGARTLNGTDYVVNVTANSFTVTLPTAVGISGRVYIIKNSGAGTTTIATTSSQTIDGASPGTLTTGQILRVQSTGANWITI